MPGWRNIVTPDSFVHPAKMAPLLCRKIFEHLEELKMIDKESLVCDFMAGTGTTNIIASMRGYQSVSVELEPRFIRLETGNRKRLSSYLGKEPKWRIVQGDSRSLSKIIGNGGASVISPPYFKGQDRLKTPIASYLSKKIVRSSGYETSNLKARGQIQNLPSIGVVSPPYRNRLDKGNEDQRKRKGTLQNEMNLGGYSSNEKNIGNLKAGVISPPHLNIVHSPGENERQRFWTKKKHLQSAGAARYGKGSNNIGNLKVGMISPPYQDTATDSKKGTKSRSKRLLASGRDPKTYLGGKGHQLDQKWYGQAKGQIAKENSETYESAMLQVYREARRASITPLVTVTKNPTRKNKLVPLDLITKNLLEKAGYQIFDYHQAVLFKSRTESSINLDGGLSEKVSHQGRIGYFKRKHLKDGIVAASWEDVIFAF